MVVKSINQSLYQSLSEKQEVYDACLVVSRPVKSWRTPEGSLIDEDTLDKLIVSNPNIVDDLQELTIGSQDDYVPLNRNIDIMRTRTYLNPQSVIMFWEANEAIIKNIDNIMGRSEVKKIDLPQGF
jgi:hypothetical protein